MLYIKSFTFNPIAENTYIIYNEHKQCAIVDPGCYTPAECKVLTDFITQHALKPIWLINTHCHLDHIFGNEYVAQQYTLPVHIHKNEQWFLDHLVESAAQFGLQAQAFTGKTIYISEADTIIMGDDVLNILFTPGHSPGSICLYAQTEKWIIGGDVLFKEGIGRTDLPGGDYTTLIKSIQTQLFILPDDVIVYPGHGMATTIGYEKSLSTK